jgi:hypothetical protein
VIELDLYLPANRSHDLEGGLTPSREGGNGWILKASAAMGSTRVAGYGFCNRANLYGFKSEAMRGDRNRTRDP